ncbi:DUF3040 domain-containing protein [Pseudonocardia adelaidensis]|uniref:DUF3040 family protein n=1 Tax=Pseudonocardia adelaidensis TaxID=648754 RepID=A0ABP9NVG5_9PSEU
MLSDRDRQVLRGVERQILNEDPAFVRSFDARAQRLRRHVGGPGIKILVVAGLLLSAFVLVAGSPGGAVLFAVATGVVWLAWRWAGDAHRQNS